MVATSSVPEEWRRLGVRGHRKKTETRQEDRGRGDLERDRDGSWPQSFRLKKGGKGRTGLSEVEPALGTESSERVPELQVVGFKRETWRTSHAKCGAGSWLKREKSCKRQGIVSSLDSNPRPKWAWTVLPGPATRPRPGLPGYRASLRSPCSAPLSPERCPIWPLSSQAPPPAAQRPRPPANALRTPYGAEPKTVGAAADAPRHVHKGKLGSRCLASPLPRPGWVGDAE